MRPAKLPLTMRTHFRFASPSRSGVSLIEVSLALIVLGVIMLIGMPKVGETIALHRLDRATALVASDLENAFAIAAREGKPIRLACSCDSGRYQLTDRSGRTVRVARTLTADSSYAVEGLAFSTTPVDIFPSRTASSADTVTISSGGYARRIVMTTSGDVRILP
jgi:prepilin-type N-terminal cleavage/methylation domain-containing protein